MAKRNPEIVLIPTQGFCNRLRALSAAHVLAEFLGTACHVMWNEEAGCKCRWEDIFATKLSMLSDLERIKNSRYWYNPKMHINELLTTTDVSQFDYLVIEGGHEFKHPDQDVIAFIRKKSEFYRSLAFAPAVTDKVSRVKEKYFKDESDLPIGVHYRDFIPAHDTADGYDFTKVSRAEEFLEIMERKRKTARNVRFFLSTNSTYMIELVKERMEDHASCVILANETNKTRESVEGMVDAVVDLLLLSECRYIVGTLSSSFSDEACFFRKIPKLCVGTGADVNTYHCYGFTPILGHKMLLADVNILFDIYKDS